MKAKKKFVSNFFFFTKKKENIWEWEMITICEKIKKHNKNENKNYLNKYLVELLF